MLEFLKGLSEGNYDSIFFLPSNKKGIMHLEGSNYKNQGDKLNTSDHGLGDMYHILIFKEDEKGEICNIDLFEGILGDPLEYISNMIKMKWFGIVCKKTTTSLDFIQDVFDKLTR